MRKKYIVRLTDEVAVSAECKDPVAVDDGCAARPVSGTIGIPLAVLGLPRLGIEGDQVLLALLDALSEEGAVGSRRGGVTSSKGLDHPNLLGAGFRPCGEQSGFSRLAVTVGAAPLIPLRRGERHEND